MFYKTEFDCQLLSSLSRAYREGRAVHWVYSAQVLFLMASQPLNLLKPYNMQRHTFPQYLELCLKAETTNSLMKAFQSFLLCKSITVILCKAFPHAWVVPSVSMYGCSCLSLALRHFLDLQLHGISLFHCLCSEWKYQDPFAAVQCFLHQHRLIPNAKQEKINQKKIRKLL